MDVVYLVKKTHNNNVELFYSLRSLCNIQHNKVFIIGYKPDWCKNVEHIELLDDGEKYENVRRKQRFILDCEAISDDFLYMNDDFYFLEPTDSVKYYKIGSLKDQMEYIKERDNKTLARGLQISKYYDNLKYVYDVFGNVDSMESHTPIMFNKQKMKKMLKEHPDLQPTSIRTSYCAYNKIKGEFLPNTPNYKGYKRELIDCKLYDEDHLEVIKGQPLLSTENTIITNNKFLLYMKHKFNKQSKYELFNPLIQKPMKFTARPHYAVSLSKMVVFNSKGEYITEDKQLITELSKLDSVSCDLGIEKEATKPDETKPVEAKIDAKIDTETTEPTKEEAVKDQAPVKDIKVLREEYKSLFDKRPYGAWDAETIQSKIDALSKA